MDSRLRRRPVGYQTWMVFLGGHFVRFVGCAAAAAAAAGVVAAGGLVVGILCLVLVVLARFAVVVVAVVAVVVAAVTVHRVQTRTRNRPLSFCDSYSQPNVSMFF